MQVAFMIFMLLTAIFLILIILVQRGKGGGLAGAFGGMGGQSAFGAKAGDLFTKITIGVAAVWIILCLGAVAGLRTGGRMTGDNGGGASQQAPANPSDSSGPAPTEQNNS